MELRQLHYFIAVAEELNFSRAAERLLITQPPLSLQIQNLEKELGIPLFFRNNRHVELTEAGKFFYKEVSAAIYHLNRTVKEAQRIHHGKVGTIKVGFVGSATYDILPAILREFRLNHPEVEIKLTEMSTPNQIEALCAEEIDIGVLRPPVKIGPLQTDVVSRTSCVLAVPKYHPLLKKQIVNLADLDSYPFIMLSRRTWSDFYDKIIEICAPTIQQEALEFQTVIGLVAGGLGIAVVPQSASHLHTRDVTYIDMKDLPTVSMGVSYLRKNRSPLVKAFIQISKEMENNLIVQPNRSF
ncbi:LysR family transcriptional regulator [Bacillus dakarensis]|uniref:LysR family transcriptional regulator n=1 Tax=Robertmurraya dakarensis TaxID=1926278 RepID=UPI0009810F3F|nr:LysR family transcriptional regulator [Bacillus dakarensis]